MRRTAIGKGLAVIILAGTASAATFSQSGTDARQRGDTVNDFLGMAHNQDGRLSHAVSSVETVAELRSLVTSNVAAMGIVYVKGYYAAGDGGEGVFCWKAGTTNADNGGTILSPAAGGTGCWLRQAAGGVVNVKWFGARGDGTADDAAAIQASLNACPPFCTLLFPGGTYRLASSLTIADKSSLRITGPAMIQLLGAGSDAYVFQLVGSISNLQIDTLSLRGEANPAYKQSGIGNSSGQNVSDVTFRDLNIANLNVGISLNADLGGTYSRATVINNTLTNLVGVNSGQGYGIHIAKATQCLISGNLIDRACRHAIYQAKGSNVCNVIANNIIRNHRKGVADLSLRSAIVVTRSSGVKVEGNLISDHCDSGMEISHDSAGFNGENIIVTGNSFLNRQNAVCDLFIGEQAVPGAYTTRGITISGNTFSSQGGGSPHIAILNGSQITIMGNTFRKTGVTGLSDFIGLGHSYYVASMADCDEIDIEANHFFADGDTSSMRAITVDNPICTNSSRHRLIGNAFHGVRAGSEIYFVSPRTNPNLVHDMGAQRSR